MRHSTLIASVILAHRLHMTHFPAPLPRRWYSLLSLSLLLFFLPLFVGCKQHTEPTSAADRQVVDSLVKEATDISALAHLQRQFAHEGNLLGRIVSLKAWGRALRNESRFEDALHIHSEGLRQAEILGDTIEWVQALNEIGTDYRRMGVLDVAQEYHYKAYVLSQAHSDTTYQAKKNRVVSLNGLGNIYMTFGNYEQAEQVLRQALSGEQELKSTFGQAINYANLGSIFENQGKIDSAWAYYRKSMALNTEAGSALGISLCHTYFGALYQKAKQYDRARQEYQAAYELMKTSKDEWHALPSLIALASIYNTTGDNTQVETYLAQAKTTAERIHSTEHLAEIHALYYRYYSRRGDYRLALENKVIADDLQDSVVNLEKINRIQNASLNIERNRQRQLMDAVQLKLKEERTKREVGFGIFALTLLVLTALVAILLYIQKLRARNHRTLQQVSRLRENFFTNITHEFRTPLTLILGLSHDLQKDASAPQPLREKAHVIERQGKSLLTLINQLLDIARIKSAVGDSEWYSGDISARLLMLTETYRDYADSRQIDLRFASTGSIVMDFVPDYLDKIVNNLLSNALKFTPEGGWVSVQAYRSEGHMYIEVSDSGIGMQPEALEHIFEPFYQARSKMRNVGSGVGLALVKQIVDAIGGDIQVKSTPGEGTTFRIGLPIAHANRPALPMMNTEAQPVERERAPQDHTEGGDCRLLIIEDNPDVAAYIGSVLSERYAVYYAANGREGLERALELMPDLIVTDLMMPEMDGIELCRAVRGNEIIDHIPVIVVTAKISDEERIRGFEAGADAYLAKPFNSDELRAVVERLLERHRLLRLKSTHPEEGSKAPEPQLSEAEQRFLNKTDDLIFVSLGKRKVEVNALAEHLCMSPRQLHRKLVALTGYPPAAYILNRKMDRAKELLLGTPEMTIEEIAERCGFEHGTSFYHAFKKLYGITPAEYRKGTLPTIPPAEERASVADA